MCKCIQNRTSWCGGGERRVRTEKIIFKITVPHPHSMRQSWCQESCFIFPMKTFLLITTSMLTRGLSNLVTVPKSNRKSLPTDSLKSVHSFIHTVSIDWAPILLPCARSWRCGRRRKTQGRYSEFCVPRHEVRWDHTHAHLWLPP